MSLQPLRALVASENKPWRSVYVEALYDEGCDLHIASSGFEAIELIRKYTYDLIVVDDSFTDLGPLEFSLHLRDMVTEMPVVLVAGEDLARFVPFWRRFGLFFVGRRTAVLRNLSSGVERARRKLCNVG